MKFSFICWGEVFFRSNPCRGQAYESEMGDEICRNTILMYGVLEFWGLIKHLQRDLKNIEQFREDFDLFGGQPLASWIFLFA